jgi:anti-sigma factor ChrR (cupin superfamily)
VKHTRATERDRERAALYALGALDPDEALRFARHLDAGCSVCAAEVAAFGAVTGDLGVPSRPVEQTGCETASRFHFRLLPEGAWREIAPGVRRKDLAEDAYLVRMAAGTRIAEHAHASVEHCYVIEGDLHIGGRHIGAGDYQRAEPGSVHETATTDDGCLILIVESGG